jgi:hypothetical protein
MGFRKPDIDPAYTAIRHSLIEISNPYNDGYTGFYCKHDLYLLKCWLEDRYQELPTFVGEEKWEQERLITVLKK